MNTIHYSATANSQPQPEKPPVKIKCAWCGKEGVEDVEICGISKFYSDDHPAWQNVKICRHCWESLN
jgi:hypothetical protein